MVLGRNELWQGERELNYFCIREPNFYQYFHNVTFVIWIWLDFFDQFPYPNLICVKVIETSRWTRQKWSQCHIYYHLLAWIASVFSCPGSFIPDLGQSVSQWVTTTLELWHKEWLLRIQTRQTFDQHDI